MICLNMILHNAAEHLRPTLESTLPWIDTFCLSVSTTTDDSTQSIVREVLRDVPGCIVRHEGDLVEGSFGKTRQQALAMARSFCNADDYILWLDAGDVVGFDRKPEPQGDGAYAQVLYGTCQFRRVHLVRASAPWVWRYRVHETLVSPYQAHVPQLDGFVVRARVAEDSPEKWLRYAKLSEADLKEHPEDTRVVFYAAQNWFAAGKHGRALTLYRKREEMGGWDQEVFYSIMRQAMCLEWLHMPHAAGNEYIRAWQFMPSRAEPLRHLARLTEQNAWNEIADKLPLPESGLFVESHCYH